MNNNERYFERKFPGKRKEIIHFLYQELKRLKKIGFPDYDTNNIAQAFTKHIINIMEEN